MAELAMLAEYNAGRLKSGVLASSNSTDSQALCVGTLS